MTISGTACHVSLKGNLSGTYLSIWGSRAKDNEKITLGNQTWGQLGSPRTKWEVYSRENHRTKWRILHCHVDDRRVQEGAA